MKSRVFSNAFNSKAIFSLLGLVVLLVAACSKFENAVTPEQSINPTNEQHAGLGFRDIDDPYNEVCTVNDEDGKGPIDLDVDVVDGVLVFADHDAFINAMDKLYTHNLEAVNEFEDLNSYTSLFTEFARIEELPVANMAGQLQTGRLNKIFSVVTNDFSEQVLKMSTYDFYTGRVLNTEGLVRIGNYIGSIGDGLNIWTNVLNKQALVQALDTRTLPENTIGFYIYDDRYFQINERDFSHSDNDCPYFATHSAPWVSHKNPDAERRIEARWKFSAITSPPNNDNLSDYTAKFILESVSKKQSWNKYKTNHYWSIDITYGPFNPNLPTTHTQMTGQNNCTKYGGKTITLLDVDDKTDSWLIANGIRLIDVAPGQTGSGATGTSISHRGMDGEYVRFSCN